MALGSETAAFFGAAGAAASGGGYTISRSLRFNSADSAYLNRTPTSAGNRKTWTWAGWVKRSNLGTVQPFFSAAANGTVDNDYFDARFDSSDTLQLYGYSTLYRQTSNVFRDASAWYHFVITVDTTSGSANNRLRIYVNGVETSYAIQNNPNQNTDLGVNRASTHELGHEAGFSRYFNGYLADIHFIDGQALDPTSFGEFDDNGIWQPIAYSGSYGTNGFHLDFADNSTAAALGTDTSGNGNDWTVNNISVLQGTGNYVPAMSSSGALTYGTTFLNGFDGNITNSVFGPAGGTMTFSPSPGIAYTSSVEVITAGDSYSQASLNGATAVSTPNNTWTTLATGSGTISTIVFSDTNSSEPGFAAIRVDGVILTDYRAASANDSLVDVPTNGTEEDTGVGGEVRGNYATLNPLNIHSAANDTISNGNLNCSMVGGSAGLAPSTIGFSSGKFYYEVVWSDNAANGVIGIRRSDSRNYDNSYIYVGTGNKYTNGGSGTSYGSSFVNGDVIGCAVDMDAGTLTFYKNGASQGQAFTGISGTYTFIQGIFGGTTGAYSVNFGQRPFAYTAPSGFKALNTANLPAPVVTKPSEYMDVALYTGNGSTQTISGLEFSPDLVWIKARSAATRHDVFDTVRGVQKYLETNSTAAEITDTNALDAFLSDGFSLGNDGPTNGNGVTFAAWTWDAGSSTVTNTQGSITSSVRANPSAGFSVITATTPASPTTNYSVGHGLGVAPAMWIWKHRDTASSWQVWHTSLGANRLQLNSTAAASGGDITAPTSSIIWLKDGPTAAWNSTIVLYAFAPVDGYSSFGSYTGNGSADGNFVYTGFRPRWLMIKDTTGSTNYWWIYDTARDTYNASGRYLFANVSDAEQDYRSIYPIDILSNGFKVRNTLVSTNNSVFVYCAFAESPFQYARAR